MSAHSLEDIEQTLLINLSGAILISKIFLPLLANEKGATIVHSGGFADGRLAFPYYSVDVASRAGIFSFIESMNRELKQEQKKGVFNLFLSQMLRTHPQKSLTILFGKKWELRFQLQTKVCLGFAKRY